MGNDVDTPAFAVERHHAVGDGEQAVVLGALDVAAGVVAGAALPDEDAAGGDVAATVDLDAQPLALRIAAVARRALTFLMCHDCLTGVMSTIQSS